MKNKQIKWIGAAALSLVLIAVAAPSAFTDRRRQRSPPVS